MHACACTFGTLDESQCGILAEACATCCTIFQVGGLIKRLDTGEGSYAKELEEDYDVAEQLDQVGRCTVCRRSDM
jgi:hypothetical protein